MRTMKGKVFLTFALVVILALTLTASALAKGGKAPQVYRANLIALNGSGVSGQVTVEVLPGNLVTVTLSARGLVRREVHMQHILGFANGSQSIVPPPTADTNGDGYISFAEALPFTGPMLLDLTPYPAGTKNSKIEFTHTYRMPAIKALDLNQVPLSKRAIMIQGGFRAAVYGRPVYDPTLPVAAARFVKN